MVMIKIKMGSFSVLLLLFTFLGLICTKCTKYVVLFLLDLGSEGSLSNQAYLF